MTDAVPFFAGYIMASAIMCIFALLLDAFATLLTGLGLWSQDSTRKYQYYRIALYVMVASRECRCKPKLGA
jgi:hypothetical protein